MVSPDAHRLWHAWKRPDVSLAHVHCFGVLLHGSGEARSAVGGKEWADKAEGILADCATFHQQELPGSVLTWSVHEPLALSIDVDALNDEPGANAFFDIASNVCKIVASSVPRPNDVASDDGTFPPALRTSGYPKAEGNSVESIPTHVVFAIFGDYGQEDCDDPSFNAATSAPEAAPAATPGPLAGAVTSTSTGQMQPPLPLARLRKYYIWKDPNTHAAAAAAGVPKELYLSDVRRVGGSRASFHGRVPVSSLAGAMVAAELLPPQPAASDATAGSIIVRAPWWSSVNDEDGVQHPQPPMVGLGIGVVTREAWLHSEIPSSACVCYHEAIGHGSNMPHPDDAGQGKWCVMLAGMYQGQPLHGSQVCICEEIKSELRRKEKDEDDDGGGGVVALPLGATHDCVASICLPAMVSHEDSSEAGSYHHHQHNDASASESGTSAVVPSIPIRVGWSYADLADGEVTVLRRPTLLQLPIDAHCMVCARMITDVMREQRGKTKGGSRPSTSPARAAAAATAAPTAAAGAASAPVAATAAPPATTSAAVMPRSIPASLIYGDPSQPQPSPSDIATRIENCLSDAVARMHADVEAEETKTRLKAQRQQQLRQGVRAVLTGAGGAPLGVVATIPPATRSTGSGSGDSISITSRNVCEWTESSLHTEAVKRAPAGTGRNGVAGSRADARAEAPSPSSASTTTTSPETTEVSVVGSDLFHFQQVELMLNRTGISSTSSSSGEGVSSTAELDSVFTHVCPTCLSRDIGRGDAAAALGALGLAQLPVTSNDIDVDGVPQAAVLPSLPPSPPRHLLLVDEPRDIAIALPLFGSEAVLSGSGLTGAYHGFHSGCWVYGASC